MIWECTKFEEICAMSKPENNFYSYELNDPGQEKGLAPWVAEKCGSMSGEMRLAKADELKGVLVDLLDHSKQVNEDLADMAEEYEKEVRSGTCFYKKDLVLKYNVESSTFTQVELGSL